MAKAPALESWNDILARIASEIYGVQMPAAPAPQAPTPGSQCETLLMAMQSGARLTVLTALDKYGVYACSQRMTDLRRLGWPVKSERLKLPSGKIVAVYFL